MKEYIIQELTISECTFEHPEWYAFMKPTILEETNSLSTSYVSHHEFGNYVAIINTSNHKTVYKRYCSCDIVAENQVMVDNQTIRELGLSVGTTEQLVQVKKSNAWRFYLQNSDADIRNPARLIVISFSLFTILLVVLAIILLRQVL